MKHNKTHNAAIKRDCELLEKEVAELQDKINATRKKQPRQGKRKSKNTLEKGLHENLTDVAATDSQPLRGSLVEPPRNGCCTLI